MNTPAAPRLPVHVFPSLSFAVSHPIASVCSCVIFAVVTIRTVSVIPLCARVCLLLCAHSCDAVLSYLTTENLSSVDLSKLCWRLKDATVFFRIIPVLRARFAFNDAVRRKFIASPNIYHLRFQGYFVAKS